MEHNRQMEPEVDILQVSREYQQDFQRNFLRRDPQKKRQE